MTSTAVQAPIAVTPATMPMAKKRSQKRLFSLESFFQHYAGKEDGYRYEWNNGIVEKTPRLSMNRDQLSIVQILTRLFTQTHAYKAMGELEREVDMFLPRANRLRKADLAYLTAAQVKEKNYLRPSISNFVVEIISHNDKSSDIQKKLEDYFGDGVQVVWHIFPESKLVHVYTSPDNITICRGATICKASPVLSDFNIPAQDMFA